MEAAEADSPSAPHASYFRIDAECAWSLPRTRFRIERRPDLDGNISAERAAQNQSLYRSVNEQITELNEAFSEVFLGSESLSEWVCECADTTCVLRVKATRQEYELVRANGRTFIVYPGHVYPEVEGVLSENERFTVVEKFNQSGQIAESLDPRQADQP